MRKGRKTKVTKYEKTHHPSNLLIFHSHPFKWIMDERFINLILQQLTPLVTKVIIHFFLAPNGSKLSGDVGFFHLWNTHKLSGDRDFSLVEHA
jgi:hypothetical protein